MWSTTAWATQTGVIRSSADNELFGLPGRTKAWVPNEIRGGKWRSRWSATCEWFTLIALTWSRRTGETFYRACRAVVRLVAYVPPVNIDRCSAEDWSLVAIEIQSGRGGEHWLCASIHQHGLAFGRALVQWKFLLAGIANVGRLQKRRRDQFVRLP